VAEEIELRELLRDGVCTRRVYRSSEALPKDEPLLTISQSEHLTGLNVMLERGAIVAASGTTVVIVLRQPRSTNAMEAENG
jgi:hypothetical protein